MHRVVVDQHYETYGGIMHRKPTAGMVVTLAIVAGFALGIGTLPERTVDDSAKQPNAALSIVDTVAFASSAESAQLKDDPATAVYEPFISCSDGYATGPGADLDQNSMIGPENSVMVSPAQMRAIGLPESEILAQTQVWNELSAEERGEQLCRAAQGIDGPQ